MAESVNGGGNQSQPSKPMERNLLLAFLLAGLVMFLSNYFLPQTPPPAKKPATAQTAPAQTAPAAASPATPEPAPGKTAATAPATQQKAEAPFVIETDLYRVSISNQGATVRSWQLKNWKGNDHKPLELVNTASGLEYPFSLFFPSDKSLAKL